MLRATKIFVGLFLFALFAFRYGETAMNIIVALPAVVLIIIILGLSWISSIGTDGG